MADVQSHLIAVANLIEACQSSYRLLKLRNDMKDSMAKDCADTFVKRTHELRWTVLRVQEHMYSDNPSGNAHHEHQPPFEEKE